MSAEQILVPQDKPLSVAVTVHDRQAVLHLSQPREYIALSGSEPVHVAAKLMTAAVDADASQGQHTVDMCLAIIDAVYEANPLMKGAGWTAKQEMLDRHRRTLIKRLEVVLNSTREKKKVGNARLAQELVEICLKEVMA